MVAFWIGLVAFWILFLAAAPSPSEFWLRAAMMVMTAGLYAALRPRHGDDGSWQDVLLWFIGAVAVLAAGGVVYYDDFFESSASAALAVSMLSLLAEGLRRRG